MVHIHFTADHVTNHDLSRWPAYDLTILIETIPLPSDALSVYWESWTAHCWTRSDGTHPSSPGPRHPFGSARLVIM